VLWLKIPPTNVRLGLLSDTTPNQARLAGAMLFPSCDHQCAAIARKAGWSRRRDPPSWRSITADHDPSYELDMCSAGDNVPVLVHVGEIAKLSRPEAFVVRRQSFNWRNTSRVDTDQHGLATPCKVLCRIRPGGSQMQEIRTSGLMSGEGKRNAQHVTAPLLDSTPGTPTPMPGSCAFYGLRNDGILPVICPTSQNVFAGSWMPATARISSNLSYPATRAVLSLPLPLAGEGWGGGATRGLSTGPPPHPPKLRRSRTPLATEDAGFPHPDPPPQAGEGDQSRLPR